MARNNFPRIHNAMWPGLVGKGPGSEPYIDLETMLELTANARVGDARFEGVDLFLFEPHIDIDSSRGDVARLAERIVAKRLVVGSLVAPVWPNTGGGSAMGTDEERGRFLEQVKKACRIGSILRDLGIRKYGVIRIDSACSAAGWATDPSQNTARIAATFRDACDIAAGYGERLAAEGEICWGGIHSWREATKLLELVDRPQTIGFQADMAHTLLYALGYNAPESRLHDKTGHHCLPDDPNGKLNIVEAAGLWMRDEQGKLLKAFRHVCWDGCMFPNSVMQKQETWNKILSTMVAVREAHGWVE
jgi:sugar phosphate isomerase/epimerase